MNRTKAFDIAGLGLDLAQELGYNVYLRNPKYLKRRYRWFANKALLKELETSHREFEEAQRLAYELYERLINWADEYPMEDK